MSILSQMQTVTIPASFVISFFKSYHTGFVTDTGALGDAWECEEVLTRAMLIFKNHVEYYYSGNISAVFIGDIQKVIIQETSSLQVPMLAPISNCICVRYFRRAGARAGAHAGSRAIGKARAKGYGSGIGSRNLRHVYVDAYENACFRACLRSLKNACGLVCQQSCLRVWVQMTYRAHDMIMLSTKNGS